MSSKNPIVLSEGTFFEPQHFQQLVRVLEHQINSRVDSVGPHPYGFTDLQINQEYLAFGKIAITHAKGVMPDGTVFNIPNDQPPPEPLVIGDSAADNQVVYLTLPHRSDGVLEIRWPEAYANHRYIMRAEELRDTHSQIGDYRPIDLAVANLQLALEREDRSAYACLPFARIRGRRADGSLLLDDSFYPTSLSLQAIPPLGRFLGEVTSLMRERARTIAERIGSPGQAGVADVTDFQLLQSLNRLYAELLQQSRQPMTHPVDLYRAFLMAASELATFMEHGRLAPELPAYRHEDLATSFQPLEATLRRYLSNVLQPRAVSLPIVTQQYGIRTASVADSTLLEQADFVLAVSAQMPVERLRQLFLQQVKVASMERLGELVSRQLPGIPLAPLPVAPRHLPYHAGFTYFQLDRNHPTWQQMMKNTAGFGFHITGDYPGLELQFWAIREATR
ncbi:type VI secretion system baseplate subunit TssK [Pseudomonas citronellolis]|jgi:type VI secretion system protein ImpJ|uniref:Type VI secretion system baseplate subunit TssK n=1 Tax=Pseudomonas citronellolis TaxID=53408 RepID=A0AAW6P0I3_9PSED|nr:type VI secretion system baseplate subunit TssK [Pseudomonas citronellolis]MDF3840265.1 type VI secretion system baseplate subunit TssK [Pseudomonas citronellolis]